MAFSYEIHSLSLAAQCQVQVCKFTRAVNWNIYRTVTQYHGTSVLNFAFNPPDYMCRPPSDAITVSKSQRQTTDNIIFTWSQYGKSTATPCELHGGVMFYTNGGVL